MASDPASLQPTRELRIPTLIVVALVVDVALIGAFMADRLFDHPMGAHVRRVLDAAEESSLITWYSTVKLFLVGWWLLTLTLAFARMGTPRTWLSGLLTTGFFILSIDEAAMIHEAVGFVMDRAWLPTRDRKDTALFHQTGIWVLVVVPVMAILLWMVISMARIWRNPGATRLFILGVIVFLGGAGSDFLGNFTAGSGPLDTLQVAIEEYLEMVGVTMILWAVHRLLADHSIEPLAQRSAPA